MRKAVVIGVLGALSCGPKPTSDVARTPQPDPAIGTPSPDQPAATGGTSYGGTTYAAAPPAAAQFGGSAYGGASYGGALPQGGPLTWTVSVTDHATGKPLTKISVTASEQTWGCKTRVLPEPPRDPDDRHRGGPRIESYDCQGAKNHVTKLTDAKGMVTLQLPHSTYQLAPIKHPDYFPHDFPDPVFRRIAGSLEKHSITNGGANRRSEYRLFPKSAVKVKTDAQAEALALQNPIVQKCLAAHPKLTHTIEKPSLLWRLPFLYSGAKSMEFEATVNTLTGDVGFLGCWDPCCANRAPSRFERRLTECAKLRGESADKRKPWDCDTLAQDYVRLQDFLRRQNDAASLQKYEALYREYEASQK